MANELQGFPFESTITGYDDEGFPILDRAMASAPYRALWKKYWTNGIFYSPSTNFAVTAMGGMNVSVQLGEAHIEGLTILPRDASTQMLTIGNASTSADRTDLVVLRADFTATRTADVYILPGKSAVSDLTRNGSVWELAIARITVRRNASQINQSDITDLRLSTDYCGVVTEPIIRTNTTAFFEQIAGEATRREQAWGQFFADIQEDLSSISVGGTQYLSGSSWAGNNGGFAIDSGNGVSRDTGVTFNDNASMLTNRSGKISDYYSDIVSNNTIQAVPGDTFVASIWVKTDNITGIDRGIYIEVKFYGASNNVLAESSVPYSPVDTGWHRIMATTSAPNGTVRVGMSAYVRRNGKVWFNSPKLERGNLATDWSDAPGDFATNSDLVVLQNGIAQTYAKKTELEATKIRNGGTITLTAAGWTAITGGFQQTTALPGVTASHRVVINPLFPSGQYIKAPIETSTANGSVIHKTTSKPMGTINGQAWIMEVAT